MSDQKLPAGQQFSVVEMDGSPYQRPYADEEQLTYALNMLGMKTRLGEVNAMWAIAEVQTQEGLRFMLVRYGVGTDVKLFGHRLEELAHDHEYAATAYLNKASSFTEERG